jgi:hypothetical protein
MPVIAVGFAAALDIGAMGALAAGTLTTLSAITAIGATVGAIGAVTHNKTLSLVGMGLGVVGAIGTLASGAGVFDNVSDLFKSSSSAAGPGGASIFDTSGVYDAASGGAGAAGATSDLADTGSLWTGTTADLPGAINATSTLAPAEGDAAAMIAAQPGGAPLAQSLATGAPDAAGAGATGSATAGAADAAAGAAAPPSFFSTPGLYDAAAGGPIGASGMAAPSAGGLMAWANKNPLLTYGLIQAGGSFISGLSNPMTPAQIDALNAQADVNRATAALIQRQTANQGAPLPRATVTGRAEPTTAGLINNKPVGSALITGTPNTGAPLATGTTA